VSLAARLADEHQNYDSHLFAKDIWSM